MRDPQLNRRVCDVLRVNGDRRQAPATGRLDRDLPARVPEPGEWSALECLNHADMTDHAVFATRLHAERAVMQAFIVGTGLRRPFFRDHDIAVKPAVQTGR